MISNWVDGIKMGFDSQQGHKISLLFTLCRPALRPKHVPLQRVQGASYAYIKYLRYDAECSAVHKAEV